MRFYLKVDFEVLEIKEVKQTNEKEREVENLVSLIHLIIVLVDIHILIKVVNKIKDNVIVH